MKIHKSYPTIPPPILYPPSAVEKFGQLENNVDMYFTVKHYILLQYDFIVSVSHMHLTFIVQLHLDAVVSNTAKFLY